MDGSVCASCSRPAGSMLCGRCACVSYCSRECQVAGWAAHKPHCAPAAALVPVEWKRLIAICGEVAGNRSFHLVLCAFVHHWARRAGRVICAITKNAEQHEYLCCLTYFPEGGPLCATLASAGGLEIETVGLNPTECETCYKWLMRKINIRDAARQTPLMLSIPNHRGCGIKTGNRVDVISIS
jgi:MYND finger protein